MYLIYYPPKALLRSKMCIVGAFSFTLKTSCHFSLLMRVIKEPNALCFEGFFLCLCLEQQKPLGAEACCSSLRGNYHQCDVLGWRAEHPGRLSSSSELAFERLGISIDLLVCLFVWTFHDSKAGCPMFLFPVSISSFTDVQFPLVLLLPQAASLFLELLSSLSLHSRRNLKLIFFSRIVLRKSLKVQHLFLLPV